MTTRIEAALQFLAANCCPPARTACTRLEEHRMQTIRQVMIVAAIAMAPTANADEISTAGKRLAKALDAMDVERLWLAKHYVNWETGAALDKPVVDGKSHTHCSAF